MLTFGKDRHHIYASRKRAISKIHITTYILFTYIVTYSFEPYILFSYIVTYSFKCDPHIIVC